MREGIEQDLLSVEAPLLLVAVTLVLFGCALAVILAIASGA